MNKEDAMAKLSAVAEKARPKIDEISTKAKAAMSEIKANFKADEGTTGVKKVQSMFVNLWKSGMVGKGALVAAGVVVLMMVVSFFSGGGSGEYRPRNVPDGMLAIKGLYMRQTGDEALEACKAIVGSSKDLVVVDFRKGIACDQQDLAAAEAKYAELVKLAEKDVEQFLEWNSNSGPYEPKGRKIEGLGDKVYYGQMVNKNEVYLKRNEKNDPFIKYVTEFRKVIYCLGFKYGYQVEWMRPAWNKSTQKMEMVIGTVDFRKISKYLKNDLEVSEECKHASAYHDEYAQACKSRKLLEGDRTGGLTWYRLVLKKDVAVTKEEVVKDWLAASGHISGEKLRVKPNNVIKILVKGENKKETEWETQLAVWVDEKDLVKEVFVPGSGIDRIFNAGDLPSEELVQLLVEKYPEIREFKLTVTSKPVATGFYPNARGTVKDFTWIYKDPIGFQVDFYERACFDDDDNKVNLDVIGNRTDYEALAIHGAYSQHNPRRYLAIKSIKPELERNFD